MRAIVSHSEKQVGTDDRFITKEYKSLSSIIKTARQFAQKINPPVRVEVWYNWDNRYKSFDELLIVE